jgi:hypothetical protein
MPIWSQLSCECQDLSDFGQSLRSRDQALLVTFIQDEQPGEPEIKIH